MYCSLFVSEISVFLQENDIDFDLFHNLIYIKSKDLILELVDRNPTYKNDSKIIGQFINISNKVVIHYDIWYSKNSIIKNRLLAILGRGETFFARNCEIKEIDAIMSNSFLIDNHLLGAAKAKYRYALVYNNRVVSIATFSGYRTLVRDGRAIKSYEWVRFANIGSSRVIGGMGKLLKHFVNKLSPDEIMSYSDNEWKMADCCYSKLGFKSSKKTPPIVFVVNSNNYTRVPKKRALNSIIENECSKNSEYYLVSNLGNTKFYWQAVTI